jgi:4'-phosphopantetheinyl transferase
MVTGVQNMIPSPLPQPNEVHVFCATLDSTVAHYVSPDEALRAERLLNTLTRIRFLNSRGLLREILARYLELQPEELDFSAGEHGKPFLSGNCSSKGQLYFNLSHSENLFLLAIATDREVGIDLENIRNDSPFHEIARLAFSPREQEELFRLSAHLQRSAFYRCWTRKEAYLKACGMGFALCSNSFNVSLLPETPISFVPPDGLSCWTLQDIDVPDNFSAALAVKGSPPILQIKSLTAL